MDISHWSIAAEIDPLQLPAVSFSERRRLPNCAAVYFVMDEQGTVLYIGCSIALASRWAGHHRQQSLSALGAQRIAWLEVAEATGLVDLEEALISRFSPRLNGRMSDARPPRRSVPVMVRVSMDMWDALDALARREESNVATVLRRLARERLEQLALQGTGQD